MRRRALLTTVGCTVVGVAGCTGGTDRTDTPRDESPTETDRPTATGGPTTTDADGTETPGEPETTDTPTADGPDGPIDVEFRQVEYVASAFPVSASRGIDPDHVVPEDEIPTALRDALLVAREDGRFETDSVSEDVLAAIDEFRGSHSGTLYPYVELDGSNYEFDHTTPTFVAELADEDLDEYDEDRLLPADERWDVEPEEVEAFVRTLTASGTHVPRAEYRRSILPDAVAEFIERYDYLEDHQGVSRIRTTVRHEDPPHAIEVTALTEADMWGRPVVDESELEDQLVAFFERVLESEHRAPTLPSTDRSLYYADDVPDSYSDLVEDDAPYVRLDDTVYAFGAGQPVYDGVPVDLSIEEGDDRREFTVTVSPAPENADSAVQDNFTFTGPGALPTVLWVTHDDQRHLLDSPAYERAKWRPRDTSPDGDPLPINQVLETASPRDEIAATYAVPEALPAETYVSRGLFNISWSVPDQTEGRYAAYPFELLITVD